MKSKLFIRIVCLILAVLTVGSVFLCAVQLFSANAAELTPKFGAKGYISDDYVNLRSGAGTNYSIVTCMRENTKITFVDGNIYNSNWYKVKLDSNSSTGYVYRDYVKVTSVPSDTSEDSDSATGYINDDYVNLRSGAGTNYSIITCMRKNTKFTFKDTDLHNSSWYNITLSDGKTGYVLNTYATKDSSKSSDSEDKSETKSVTGYVNDDYVNLRSGAGTNYSIITCMREDTKFTFIDTDLHNSSWYNIKLSDGRTGYIMNTYATMNSTPSDDDTSDDSDSSIELSNTDETVYVGNTFALTASGASSYSWSSSDTSVASVDSNGIVTAKSSGSVKITASSGSEKATCKFTVKSGSNVNISSNEITGMRCLKSVLLTSTTSGVKWKTSNPYVVTVDNGVVDTKHSGYATVTAYTSGGAATCLIQVTSRDNIQFVYASPNSAPKNSNVTFKAITDRDRVALRFVVSNGSTSYTVEATSKTEDGDTYVWSASKQLPISGKWTVKAYSRFRTSDSYLTTPQNGEGEVFVTNSSDTTTTVIGERRASDEVINLIANYEGFLSKVTADSITSDPTLGYGKVVTKNEQFYNNLTENQAYAYLCQTVNNGGYTTVTNKYLTENNIKFNQQQFDALVCFAYNVGYYALYNDSDLQSVLLNTGSGGSDSGSISAGASGYVNSSYVNLRSGPGMGYNILTCMDENTKFTFTDGEVYNSNWYKIKLSDGTVGYIYSSYASASSSSGSGTRDLNNVSKQAFANNFFAYHHASGSCYWGLLYRRVDEAEMFFYGDYARDGQYNKKGFSYTCYRNGSMSIG